MPRSRDDYDDDDPPPRRKRRLDEDDDDNRSYSKRRRVDDDDDDRPSSRRRFRDDEDDDYEERPRQKKIKPKKKKRPKEMSVVGMVALAIGAIALLLSFIPCFASISLVPAGIGIITGFVGLVISQKSDGRQGPGLPIAGMGVSAVAVLVGIGWLVLGKQIEKQWDREMKEVEAEIAKEEAQRKDELAKAATEVKNAQPGAVIRVTAAQFYNAYDDEDRADGWYKNKVLEVTGAFDEVDFRGSGETYIVHLKGGADEDETVECHFAKDQAVRARLAALRPGQQVIIRGKCLGGGPIIEACILVQ
jgi:hypothetical protein